MCIIYKTAKKTLSKLPPLCKSVFADIMVLYGVVLKAMQSFTYAAPAENNKEVKAI